MSTTLAVHQYRANNDPITDAESKAIAANTLRHKFREAGLSMITDPVPGPPEPVDLNSDATGWYPHEGGGKPDGMVILWTATGEPGVTDPEPLPGGENNYDLGTYTVRVPEAITTGGGPIRVRHNLNSEVVVQIASEKGPMGYLFSQDVSPDETHVETLPGTVTVFVKRAPLT